jgi:hypothetical protein
LDIIARYPAYFRFIHGYFLILVACYYRLGLISAIRVLYNKLCLNLQVQIILNMFHRVDLLVFDRLFVPRAVSVMLDLLGPSWPPMVMFGLLLERLSVNSLVVEASLRFYQVVQLIKCHRNVGRVD